jgi:hypothetical protein
MPIFSYEVDNDGLAVNKSISTDVAVYAQQVCCDENLIYIADLFGIYSIEADEDGIFTQIDFEESPFNQVSKVAKIGNFIYIACYDIFDAYSSSRLYRYSILDGIFTFMDYVDMEGHIGGIKSGNNDIIYIAVKWEYGT